MSALLLALSAAVVFTSTASAQDLHREAIERLEALGYLGGTKAPSGREGITVHQKARAQPGLNLYASGHGPEAVLMDMSGKRLHAWRHDFETLRSALRAPASAAAKPGDRDERHHWRRVRLLPGGELLAIHTHSALIKLDRNSKLLWEYTGRAHHDLDVAEDGRIYLLTNERRVLPRIDPKLPVIEDFVVVLDRNGRQLERISLLESLENAGLQEILAVLPRRGDLLHTNSIEILDGRLAERLPAFAKGNVLVSFPTLNAIAVVDIAARRVVWSMRGDFRLQHDPTVLANGRLLLFDNFGPAFEGVEERRKRGFYQNMWHRFMFTPGLPERPGSAVLEIEPVSGKVAWAYRGSEKAPFSSETCGTSQRLANGNTLVTETEHGRAFEVTPEGEIVWEFVSPHRYGDRVARLFELIRLEPGVPFDWLGG